jgi:hypothetical protein
MFTKIYLSILQNVLIRYLEVFRIYICISTFSDNKNMLNKPTLNMFYPQIFRLELASEIHSKLIE